MPSGYTSFRFIVVKLFYTQELNQSVGEQSTEYQYNSELNSELNGDTIEVQIPEPEVESAVPPKRGRPRKQPLPDVIVFIQEQFQDSYSAEITGLLEKGVFEVINRATIPQGIYIFNSRFVNEVKNKGTNKAFEKSRLII